MSFYEDVCGKTFEEIRDELECIIADNAAFIKTELAKRADMECRERMKKYENHD